jgi:hypothetical protein
LVWTTTSWTRVYMKRGRPRNYFVPVDFMVLEMDVCHQIPLILGRPFLSTSRATIVVAARIIKLNISRKRRHSH